VGNRSRFPAEFLTLAEELRRRGWRTGAVVSSAILGRTTHIDRGFDLFDQELEQREGVRTWVNERTAAPTTDAAIRMLDELLGEGDAPVFLWVHYQDPHGSYTPPPGQRERRLARERARPGGRRELPRTDAHGIGGIPRFQYIPPHAEVAWYRAGYAGEVSHLDAELGRLYAAIDSRPELTRAVLVFTADHGEDLGERDHWFAHGEYLTEAVLRVPLLVRAPGHPPTTRDDLATLLDVLPTLDGLFSLGIESPLEGRDLFAADAASGEPTLVLTTGPEAASGERVGIVRGEHKLVRARDGGEERLFRIEGSREVPLDSPAISAGLRAELDARLGHFPEHPPPLPIKLSPEQYRRLQALGYVD
jgi:arylsulfatase